MPPLVYIHFTTVIIVFTLLLLWILSSSKYSTAELWSITKQLDCTRTLTTPLVHNCFYSGIISLPHIQLLQTNKLIIDNKQLDKCDSTYSRMTWPLSYFFVMSWVGEVGSGKLLLTKCIRRQTVTTVSCYFCWDNAM